MKKIPILFIAVALVAAVLIFIIKNKFSIEGRLPVGVAIVEEYRSSGLGNGDFTYAFKAAASEEQYARFCEGIGIPMVSGSNATQIGYTPSSGDVPYDQKDWWNEPEVPKLKAYLKGKRGFTRVAYFDGNIYYLAKGW